MDNLLEKNVLTTGQVAKICHVAPRTVSKWFDTGQLQGYRIPGSKDRRIPVDKLLRFMESHVTVPRIVVGFAGTTWGGALQERSHVADAGGAAEAVGEVGMVEHLGLGFEATHRLGPNLQRQADHSLRGVVRRVPRIVTDPLPRPLDVLQQLIDLPQQALSAVNVAADQSRQFFRHRRRPRLEAEQILQVPQALGLQRPVFGDGLAVQIVGPLAFALPPVRQAQPVPAFRDDPAIDRVFVRAKLLGPHLLQDANDVSTDGPGVVFPRRPNAEEPSLVDVHEEQHAGVLPGHRCPRPVHAQHAHVHRRGRFVQASGLLAGGRQITLDAAFAAAAIQAGQELLDGAIAQTQHVEDHPQASQTIGSLAAVPDPFRSQGPGRVAIGALHPTLRDLLRPEIADPTAPNASVNVAPDSPALWTTTIKLHVIPDRWYLVVNHDSLLAIDGLDTYRIGKEAFVLPSQPQDLGQLRTDTRNFPNPTDLPHS